ncbi:histidine phosphatase family protein [Domibacillus sp.]|uniref:histidine phosphatase family protein n=1 Tax=Domibacillus sp. TaxID=1969783 RepID=UPI0028112740|nr:histidine phosphatase family protein [Domibacillus sp.]
MKTILLIRHGRSAHTESRPMTGREFSAWVQAYNEAGVQESSFPKETVASIKDATCLITSDLVRSIESAKYLNPAVKVQSDALFREVELPVVSFTRLKLPPAVWTVLLRTVWLAGYSRHCESYKEAKRRAEKGAQQLAVAEHRSIALVGHGFFNQLLAGELRKNGWKGRRKTNSNHWCSTLYILE